MIQTTLRLRAGFRYYSDMETALARAKSIYRSESEIEREKKVNEMLRTSWSFEHNRGVEILQTDSTLTENAYNLAASHFNNAIIIIPDSVVSYKMKAQAHYRNHQVGQAIATLESAYSRIDRLPSGMLEQLAFLYLEQDRGEKAVELYEKAESFSDDNLNLIHGLANAYITSGRHELAVDLLRVMVQNEPENIIYLQSYGNELYKLGIQKYKSIRSLDSNDTVAVQRVSAQADTLLKRAQEQYTKALDLNADNQELRRLLATYHQNYAVQLQRTLSRFPDEEQRAIERRIETHLTDAIKLFEQLVEESPNRNQYWRHLYQAYSYLGMQQKANEAKAKANL